MIQHLILNLIYACASIILIYLVGKIITSFFNNQPSLFFRLFITYSVGLLALIFCYSVIKSGGRTINIVLLPAIFLILHSLKDQFRKPKLNLTEIRKELVFSILALIPIFIFQSFFYIDIVHGTFKSLHSDYYSYADYANSLKLFGAESKYSDINYFFPEFSFSLVPYHYPELWATAFFSGLFRVSTIGSYFLIVVPILLTIYMIGIIVLFEKSFKSLLICYAVSLLCLFICGFHADNGVLSLFSQKLVFIYIYALLAFIVASRFQNSLYLIVLSIIPVLSISFVPAVIGGILLYNFITLAFDKFKFSRELILSSSLVMFNLMGIALFYLSFKSDYTESVIGKEVFIYKLLHNCLELSDIRTFIANFVKNTTGKIEMYLPFLIVIIFYFQELKRYWHLVICCLTAAVICYCLMFDTLDAKQFADNPNLFIHIIIIMGISFYFKSKNFSYSGNLFLRFVFLYLISVGLMESFTRRYKLNDSIDHVFFKQVEHYIQKDVNTVLVFLNRDDYKKFRLAWSYINNDLLPVTQYTPRHIIFTLGNSELFFEMNKNRSSEDSFYYKYLIPVNIEQKDKKPDLMRFIKEHGIQFIYTKNGVVLPDTIRNSISKQIVSEKTGDAFSLLKQNNSRQ